MLRDLEERLAERQLETAIEQLAEVARMGKETLTRCVVIQGLIEAGTHEHRDFHRAERLTELAHELSERARLLRAGLMREVSP